MHPQAQALLSTAASAPSARQAARRRLRGYVPAVHADDFSDRGLGLPPASPPEAGQPEEVRQDSLPEVTVGVLAAPGTEAVAEHLTRDMTDVLSQQFPGVRWASRVVVDRLVQPPAGTGELVAAARERLLHEDFDLALVLTDLPLQVSRRPQVGHASPMHAVGLVSVPALGALAVRRRAQQVAVRLVHSLLGRSGADIDVHRLHERAKELGSEVEGSGDGVGFAARVLTGHLRLLVGMVVANRPWRLAARLSRALVAAVAAGVFALVTSDVWRLADAFGALRHVGVALSSVLGITATLVIGAQLWERAPNRRVRQQVLLFNAATTATVLIGVVVLYAALFALALVAALLLVVPELLSAALGHPAGLADYAELAWLTSSLATVGGALGAGLETDEAVRQAAYSHRGEAGAATA